MTPSPTDPRITQQARMRVDKALETLHTTTALLENLVEPLLDVLVIVRSISKSNGGRDVILDVSQSDLLDRLSRHAHESCVVIDEILAVTIARQDDR